MAHLSHHSRYSGQHVYSGGKSICCDINIYFFCFIKTIIQLFDRIKPKFKKLLKKIFCHKTSGFSVHVNVISDGARWNLRDRTHVMCIIPRRYYKSTCRILQYRNFQVVHIMISIYANHEV